jgi:hypothetical protein
MAPGPLTSSARGGYGYSFSRSQAFASRASTMSRHAFESPSFGRNRDLGQRQKFAVSGGVGIALTPGAGEAAGVGPDGTITITVPADALEDTSAAMSAAADDLEPGAADTGDGALPALISEPVLTSEPLARQRTGRRERLLVAANPDGSVTLAPSDPANEVLVIGNPASGEVDVVEARPIAER